MDKTDLISLPVELSSFNIIKDKVFSTAGDTSETHRALLACDEVLTNIVSYSNATRLDFSCYKQDSSLNITFSDNGIPFDPTTAPLEEKEFEFLDSGGMGLYFVRKSAQQLRYSFQDGFNTLFLQFSL